MIKVVLSSSYPILLEGLEHAFRSEPGFRVLALSETRDQIVSAVVRHHPDVLLLDVDIEGDPIEVVKAVSSSDAGTRVVLLATRVDEDLLFEATRFGAKGVVLKAMGRQLLVQCVRTVHQGSVWLERASTGHLVDRLVRHDEGYRAAAAVLSAREFEIVALVVAGRSNKEIASRLSISEGTVKVHLHHVYEKLNIRGRLELALYARDRQLFLSHPSGD